MVYANYSKLILILVLGYIFTNAQSSNQRLDNLILFGEGWRFGVKEPKQWHGDTEKAEGFKSNIIFYQTSTGLDNNIPLIRIKVNSKVDDNTQADLDYDMEGYKKEVPNIQFKDIHVQHKSYRCFPKLFFVSNDFYEYVTYVNPGKNIPWTLAVSMHKKKTEATEIELGAYREIISSIKWLSVSVK